MQVKDLQVGDYIHRNGCAHIVTKINQLDGPNILEGVIAVVGLNLLIQREESIWLCQGLVDLNVGTPEIAVMRDGEIIFSRSLR